LLKAADDSALIHFRVTLIKRPWSERWVWRNQQRSSNRVIDQRWSARM